MLQFWRNHKFREVEINPEHHAFAQARWDAWIHSPEYEKIFRQYFREYDGQQLAGDHDFDDWNYRQFMHSAAYNQALAGWVWCRKYDEEKEKRKQISEKMDLEWKRAKEIQWFHHLFITSDFGHGYFECCHSYLLQTDYDHLHHVLYYEPFLQGLRNLVGKNYSDDELRKIFTDWFVLWPKYFRNK